MARYADAFLDALTFPHQITVRGELWYNNALVGPIDVANGSINCDRSGSVRRTAQITLDPSVLKSTLLAPRLKPYGSRIKLWRGIRYATGATDEVQCFYGRIDAVNASVKQGVDLTCSDLAADVVDARFLDPNPMRPLLLPTPNTTKLDCIKRLIEDVLPELKQPGGWNTTGITDTGVVRSGTAWAQERGDALDSLCTQLNAGSEWYIDMNGVGNVHPLPAVISSGTPSVWIIDSGDVGVIVEQVATLDRQSVFNGISVEGEPIGGETPAQGIWKDDPAYGGDPNSPTKWGGPYGKVTGYYQGMQLDPNTTAGANALAKSLGLNSIASVQSLAVTCIPNPKLKLGDVVSIYTGNLDFDGVYFVQNMVLPLDPESPMTMTVYRTVQLGTTRDTEHGWRFADWRIPEGSTWQPTR